MTTEYSASDPDFNPNIDPDFTDEEVQDVIERNAAAQPDIINGLSEKLDRLINHVNREIGVAQDTPLHSRVDTFKPNYAFGGFTFSLLSIPKQDAMISGENSVGRPGMVLQAFDGERTFVLAKLEWDHRKKTFVLYTGQGVTG
jgi:hypothetical protein